MPNREILDVDYQKNLHICVLYIYTYTIFVQAPYTNGIK